MRTTLTIDDDVLAHARSHAQRERITLGEALSRLAREGIRARSLPADLPGHPTCRFSLLPARGEIITSEHVRDLMDREGM